MICALPSPSIRVRNRQPQNHHFTNFYFTFTPRKTPANGNNPVFLLTGANNPAMGIRLPKTKGLGSITLIEKSARYSRKIQSDLGDLIVQSPTDAQSSPRTALESEKTTCPRNFGIPTRISVFKNSPQRIPDLGEQPPFYF